MWKKQSEALDVKVIKLNLLERLVIPALLPQNGDYATLCSLKVLGKMLDVPAKEMQKYGFNVNQQTGMIGVNKLWKNARFEYEFTAGMREAIKGILVKKDEAKELSLVQKTLYKKFVLEDYSEDEDDEMMDYETAEEESRKEQLSESIENGTLQQVQEKKFEEEATQEKVNEDRVKEDKENAE